MAFAVQQLPSREAEKVAGQMGGLPYSRSSFERVAHAVGGLYVAQHSVIEDVLVKEMQVPKEGRSVSVGIDRVSIPMEEPHSLPSGPRPKDAPQRPISRNFRMAYVGTVTLQDKKGNAL